MTKEEKKLLLKDLCARVPYGVKAQVRINTNIFSEAHKPDSETWIGDIWGITTNKPLTAWVYSFITIYPCGPEQNMCSIADCKPYLRPMSSMTDGEKAQVRIFMDIVTDENYGDGYSPSAWDAMNSFVQYCDSHHLDHRGLIEKGLALEAPEGMYNIK